MDDNPSQGLAAYVRQAALDAGYDIDKPRGGAKLKLARAAGMDPSTLSRLLSGQRTPDPRHYEGLATALKVDPVELLYEAGILARTSIKRLGRDITPEEAADELGLRDEGDRAMFFAMVKKLGAHRERPRSRAPRYVVADLWLNPEDNGRHAHVSLYATDDGEEADRAIRAPGPRHRRGSGHRVLAFDMLDPAQVKDISALLAEYAEDEEEFG